MRKDDFTLDEYIQLRRKANGVGVLLVMSELRPTQVEWAGGPEHQCAHVLPATAGASIR